MLARFRRRAPVARWALLALLVPIAAAAAPAAPAARNLLLNPGFEKGAANSAWMPAAWDTSESGLPTVFFGRDSVNVHSGTWSVNIANMSEWIPVAHYWGQEVVVGREAWGREAVLRVWTRCNGLSGRAYLAAMVFRDTVGKMSKVWNVSRDEALERLDINRIDDPIMDLGWGRVYFEDARTDWVQREVRAYVPAGSNSIAIRLGVFGTGQVVFDDASLTLEPSRPATAAAPGVNVLADPGLEATPSVWELSIPPYDGARIDPDTERVHEGGQSMRISGAREGLVNTRMGLCQPIDGRRLRGKHVRFTTWLRGDSLETTCYLKLYATGPHGRAQSPGTEQYSGSFDWQQASIEWDVPRDAELVWAWVIKNVPAPGELWVDDASLVVVGPSREQPEAVAAPKRTTPKAGGAKR